MTGKNLLLELEEQAQNEEEASELFTFSKGLKISIPNRSLALKLYQFGILSKRLEEKRKFGWVARFLLPLSVSLTGFLFCTAVVIYASKNSLPGDYLYPIKQASEAVLSLVNQHYKDESPVRRSAEIESLIERNNSAEAEKTLKSYQNQVKTLPESDKKEVIQKSEENLRQAEKSARGEIKKEIDKTLNGGSVKGLEIESHKTKPQEKQSPELRKTGEK